MRRTSLITTLIASPLILATTATQAQETVISTTAGLTVPNNSHNGCCYIVFGPSGGTPTGTGGNWGYGVGYETSYGGSEGGMGYTGTHFVGVADAGLGPGTSRNDAYDYFATIGLNDGSGWHGFTPHTGGGSSPNDFTRYDYSGGSVEMETGVYAHPSGLDVQIAHMFFFDYPVLRVWGRMTNNTGSPISVDVYYGGNIGSDGGLSQLIAESGGNGDFDPTDWWTLTDDGDGGGDSSLLHIWQHPSMPFPFAFDSNNVDNHYLRTGNGSSPAITIDPGETMNLLFFEEMAQYRATLLEHVQTDHWYDDLATISAQGFLAGIPEDTFFANWGSLGPLTDTDEDGVADIFDNCPDLANPDQEDADNDGTGDACNDADDFDDDEFADDLDNCPDDYNPDQADGDGDGIGDICDPVFNSKLYANGWNRDGLYEIDVVAQTVTRITSPNSNSVVPEIQITPDGQSIIRYDWSYQLRTIDRTTGATTNYVTSFLDERSAMTTALEYVDDTLYGAITRVGTVDSHLATIDPTNGAYTIIGRTGNQQITGMSYTDGTMYAVGTPQRAGLGNVYTVDLGTGLATTVAPITFNGQRVDHVTGLTIADGVAYAIVVGRRGQSNPYLNHRDLFSIDLTSGVLTREFTLTTAQSGYYASLTSLPGAADGDDDGVPDNVDNCPDVENPGQEDEDDDGFGDLCDPCPLDHADDPDSDEDGVCNADDICPGGDDRVDTDEDGIPDFCDDCPNDPLNDIDEDGVCGDEDNCPFDANADQDDADDDEIGDTCDACPLDPDNDIDTDEVCGDVDNCPDDFNPDQADYDGDLTGDACDPNNPPVADCTVLQLTNIGDRAEVSLSGAGSTDEEDDFLGTELTYEWAIDDGATVLNVSGKEITELLEYGDYVVTLTVTDSGQGAGSEVASDSVTCNVMVNPAALSVFECEKVEVKFCLGDADSDSDSDSSSADDGSSGCTSDRVKIKGEIGLPMGVDYAELEAIALVMVDAAGVDFGTGMLVFEVNGGHDEHWKHRSDTGITKLDIDWKGARFKYKESGVPVEFETELITSGETILTMEYKMDDIGGPFTVDIDGTVLTVSAEGVVSSEDLPAEAIEVKKTGKKVTVTLPFPLIEGSEIDLAFPEDATTVVVADHYTSSLGRFKLETELGDSLDLGAGTTPRTAGMWIGVGVPLYPGSCDATEDDLKVHSRKWKAKY